MTQGSVRRLTVRPCMAFTLQITDNAFVLSCSQYNVFVNLQRYDKHDGIFKTKRRDYYENRKKLSQHR